jgi:hypothetical protein
MRNILRRIKKLEKRLTDASGLVPNSEAWFDYWKNLYDEYLEAYERSELTGEAPPDYPKGITLAFLDRIVEEADRADGLIP